MKFAGKPSIFPNRRSRRIAVLPRPVVYETKEKPSAYAPLYEHRADRLVLIDALDGFRKEGGHRQNGKVRSVFSSGSGMVSKSTNSLIALLRMRSIAGPERTACVAQAVTSFAPFSMMAAAALQGYRRYRSYRSTRITFFPSTLPMIFITSQTLAFWRRLSTIARLHPMRAAKLRARVTEPRSGKRQHIHRCSHPHAPS